MWLCVQQAASFGPAGSMSDAERCRERATRLLAMALRACEYGDMDFAQRLMARATEFLEVASVTDVADLGYARMATQPDIPEKTD
jgi:hypothetical protein